MAEAVFSIDVFLFNDPLHEITEIKNHLKWYLSPLPGPNYDPSANYQRIPERTEIGSRPGIPATRF